MVAGWGDGGWGWELFADTMAALVKKAESSRLPVFTQRCPCDGNNGKVDNDTPPPRPLPLRLPPRPAPNKQLLSLRLWPWYGGKRGLGILKTVTVTEGHSLRDLHRCGSRWLSKQILDLDVQPSVKNHLKTNNVALKELVVSDFIKN